VERKLNPLHAHRKEGVIGRGETPESGELKRAEAFLNFAEEN